MSISYGSLPDYKNVYYSDCLHEIPTNLFLNDDTYHQFKVERLQDKASSMRTASISLGVLGGLLVSSSVTVVTLTALGIIHPIYFYPVTFVGIGFGSFCLVYSGLYAKETKKTRKELSEVSAEDCDKQELRRRDLNHFLKSLDSYAHHFGRMMKIDYELLVSTYQNELENENKESELGQDNVVIPADNT